MNNKNINLQYENAPTYFSTIDLIFAQVEFNSKLFYYLTVL